MNVLDCDVRDCALAWLVVVLLPDLVWDFSTHNNWNRDWVIGKFRRTKKKIYKNYCFTFLKACWYCLFLKAYMNGLMVADIHARTDATTWMVGNLTSSSTTLTSMSGRKHTRKERKMVSIIFVSLKSSFLWEDWTQFSFWAEVAWCFWTFNLKKWKMKNQQNCIISYLLVLTL